MSALQIEGNIATQIRRALSDSLKAIPGLQPSPYPLASPTAPAAHILRGEVLYDQAMNSGLQDWTFLVQVFVGVATDQGAQILLDSYLSPDGPRSVKAALEVDPRLGGLIQDMDVLSAAGEQIYIIDNRQYLGSEWTVRILL